MRSAIKMLQKKEEKKKRGEKSNFPHSQERNSYFHDLIIQNVENFYFFSFNFIMLHGARNKRTFSCKDFFK